MLRDSSTLEKNDYIHFIPFFITFIGYIPYFFTSWDYKMLFADNILSEHWDTQIFNLNFIVPHKIDQGLNVLHIYFYAMSLWYLFWKYKRIDQGRIFNLPQFRLIRNWIFIFTLIVTIITINFTITIAKIWIYDDKSIFLQKASGALLFASIVYVGMNMIVMFFPHIMYGLAIENKETVHSQPKAMPISIQQITLEDLENSENHHENLSIGKKLTPNLFSPEYIGLIDDLIRESIESQSFLKEDFKINGLSEKSDIAPHHLSYYFNHILNTSFTDWRNKIRIDHAVLLIKEGQSNIITFNAIAMQCGYSSQNTFNRAFKNIMNCTPSEYLSKLK
jgi:AraC-like DNA-binding protein